MSNHLDVGPPGGAAPEPDNPVNATRHAVALGPTGARVYGAYFEGAMGYRIDATKGIPTGNDPETLYMVTSGKHFNAGCCFDCASGWRACLPTSCWPLDHRAASRAAPSPRSLKRRRQRRDKQQ